MKICKSRLSVYLAIAVMLLFCDVQGFAAQAEAHTSDIVFVVDVSGSMATQDSENYISDALKLGIDLASANSRIGLVAVNNEVVSELPLISVSLQEERRIGKDLIDSLRNEGNTNFYVGISRAIEILSESESPNKRVIFIGDFSEGGFTGGVLDDLQLLEDLPQLANANGIKIDTILLEEAPANNSTSHYYVDLAEKTGASKYEVTSSKQIPAVIEEIYFNNYRYSYTFYTVQGEASQTIQISMPIDGMNKARIYVSPTNPASSFGSIYVGGTPDGESTASYSMVHLERPSKEGIAITLTPGSTNTAYVYLILEYDVELSVDFSGEVLSDLENNEYYQIAKFQVKIVNAETGSSLVNMPLSEGVRYTAMLTAPNGQVSEYDLNETPEILLKLNEAENFGEYIISAQLVIGGLFFLPKPQTVSVIDNRADIIVEVEPDNGSIYVAVAIACLLILIALIIAMCNRKKKVSEIDVSDIPVEYRFQGKLSVYSILLDGGDREIRPFDFALAPISERLITLRKVLDSSGVQNAYIDADEIVFTVGPEESIIIRNNSKTIQLRVAGRHCGHNTRTQLFYDQKVYAIFEKDENELEINYRRVKKVESSTQIQFNIHSRRAR